MDASSASSLLGTNVSLLSKIQPLDLRADVLYAFTKSISYLWIVSTPLAGVSLIMVCFMRKYTLKRQIAGKSETAEVKAEKAEPKDAEDDASEETVVEEATTSLQAENETPNTKREIRTGPVDDTSTAQATDMPTIGIQHKEPSS